MSWQGRLEVWDRFVHKDWMVEYLRLGRRNGLDRYNFAGDLGRECGERFFSWRGECWRWWLAKGCECPQWSGGAGGECSMVSRLSANCQDRPFAIGRCD